jgi:hypothetical protein
MLQEQDKLAPSPKRPASDESRQRSEELAKKSKWPLQAVIRGWLFRGSAPDAHVHRPAL